MFSRRFFAILLCLAVLGLYLISREWVAFLVHLQNLWSWQHSIMAVFALGLAKITHEFGHAFAAVHLGLRVPRMGIALMCFTPVLWTDVTEAWKLPRRSDRLLVDAAGVGAELMLATGASLLWPLLPPGAAKSAVLMLAGVTWLTTLTVNANPFMRYDGYYLLSDYWDIPGLQQRSFAFARWKLRQTIFGFGDPPPEAMPRPFQNKLILYAYCTWVYRFFLFLGIALLVYHFFFKALGLALMVVELVWFLALPIYKELAHWCSRRSELRLNWRSVRSGLALLGLIIFFVVPWHSRIEAPGLLTTEQQAVLYAQQPAQVQEILVQSGDAVHKGQVLLVLASPDIQSKIALAEQKLESLRLKLALASLDPELRVNYSVDVQEMLSVATDLEGLRHDQARLVVHAPFAGTFHDLPAWISMGGWVPEKTKLGLVTAGGALVSAYVAEEELERLAIGMTGGFYPGSGFFAPLPARVIAVDSAAVRDILQLELPNTTPGGIIPAKRTSGGRIVPEQALYKILCRVETDTTIPAYSLSGTLRLNGQRRSFAARLWQAALGVLIRESGWN